MPSDPIADKPLYPSDNAYGIPNLRHTPLSAVPDWLIPYRTRIRPEQSVEGGAVHFFLFDAIFESVWNCPSKSRRYLQRFKTLLSPDFSLNPEMPLALQIYNVYRNRWCAAAWQRQGYSVIPSIGWSNPASYEFCFLGIPQNTVIALTTLGSRRQKQVFQHGFDAMIERLQPSIVLCYGKPFPEMERVALKIYPNRWEGIRQAKAGQDG
jgi:hypothetical protein